MAESLRKADAGVYGHARVDAVPPASSSLEPPCSRASYIYKQLVDSLGTSKAESLILRRAPVLGVPQAPELVWTSAAPSSATPRPERP